METGNLADRLAAIGRWTTLVILALVFAASNNFDAISAFIFAIVLGMMTQGGPTFWIGGTIGLTLLFVAFMLTIGRWLIHAWLPWLQAKTSWPGGVLAFALALSLLSAAFTEWIGIHAVFGSFMAGVALGDSHHLRERTRANIHQFVSSVFAPLFFASAMQMPRSLRIQSTAKPKSNLPAIIVL